MIGAIGKKMIVRGKIDGECRIKFGKRRMLPWRQKFDLKLMANCEDVYFINYILLRAIAAPNV